MNYPNPLLDAPCRHGWIMPPECPQCLTIERDHLSEMLRVNTEKIRFLNHRIERLNEILDEAYDVITNHHSSNQMRPNVCPVCSDPMNEDLLDALYQNRHSLNELRRTRGEDKPIRG